MAKINPNYQKLSAGYLFPEIARRTNQFLAENEGAQVMQEVEDLNTGLKDTVKAVAEELNVKPSLINKAIKVAMKRDWDKHQDEFEDLETIVATVGVDK